MWNLFWVAMPTIIAVYYFGVFTGRAGIRQAQNREPFGQKYFYDCEDCVPGVNYRITADTKDHLRQVIEWHEHDHHEAEPEPDYGVEYVPADPLTRLEKFRDAGWVMVWQLREIGKRVKKHLTLPAWRTNGHQQAIDKKRHKQKMERKMSLISLQHKLPWIFQRHEEEADTVEVMLDYAEKDIETTLFMHDNLKPLGDIDGKIRMGSGLHV